MKITRISRLQNHGVYRDFTWPPVLPDFRQYNLIYGWNGTGKTTLSRLFRDLEFRRPPTLGKIRLCIDGNSCTGEEFPKSSLHIRVFNRDFIQENVFPLEGRDMPPILVLGAENVEKQKEVKNLKDQLITTKKELKSLKSTEQNAKKTLDDLCRNCARGIKDSLRVNSQSRYNNYDKSNFKTDATNIVDNIGDSITHQLTDIEREKLLLQHRATSKPKVNEITYDLPNLSNIMSNLSKLLAATVVSEVIEILKADIQLADWVRQGLSLHQDRNSELCQFCGQPLPRSRIARLEKHFSDQYERLMQHIDQEINQLNAISETSAKLRLPAKAEIYDDLASEYYSKKVDLENVLQSVQNFTGVAVQALNDKKSRLFEQVSFGYEMTLVNTGVVEELNVVIRKHNENCDCFKTRAEEARKQLANDMIIENLEEFIRYNDNIDTATNNIEIKNQEILNLNHKIKEIEQEIVEHRRPAEELNEDLQKYLGYDELSLEIKETGYAMTRNSIPAKSLSEGETTAIALLYFLKSLEDKEFEREKGVIVLDDPVSSLDANALFLAFGFIRERTVDSCQLFILTHNFSLFQQVRNWFHHLKGQKKKQEEQRPARFYMLESVLEGGVKSSTIRRLDPLLEKYDSEYHYLFTRVYNASNEESSSSLEKNYVLPNMARRMLEAFLAFRVPGIMGNLRQQLDEIQFDKTKKLRIYRFLHTYSHSVAVGEPEHDLSALNEGPSVLKDLMDMIKSEDLRHFSAMRDLVTQSREPDTAS